MLKKYQSSSHVVLNVVMEGGQNVHLSFDPLTGGGSSFTTADEKLQAALERHRHYGKLFTGCEVQETPVEEAPVTDEPQAGGVKQVPVSSLDDAKEYLADNYGYSRTKLRSKTQILAAAAEKGIEFVGI